MSKIVKVLLLGICGVLVLQCIKSFMVSTKHEELLELEYAVKKAKTINTNQIDINKMTKRGENNVTILSDIPGRLPTDLKYILKFTQSFYHKYAAMIKGQDEFIDAKCKHINCFITDDRRLLHGLQHFDAILFDLENYWDGYPTLRSTHQKYIFVATEPSQDNPICNKLFDDFYNLTWTYKLDSDITWPFLTILDKNGTVIGPKRNMTWLNNMDAIPKEVKKKLEKKSKVAAWFVSNCVTPSNRAILFEKLQLEFWKFNVSLDSFGMCAEMQCPKDRMQACLELVERDYHFYLAFENSVCEDYVTGNVLHALLHYAVPIVYGGANYTRFLPPGSYINADDETPENVVALVMEALGDRGVYEDYFRWHNHYAYKKSEDLGDVCALCEVLNRPPTRRTVTNFRQWWNPQYKSLTDNCKNFY